MYSLGIFISFWTKS